MKEKNKAKNLVEMFNQSTRKYAECRCQWWRTDTGSTASLDYDQVGLIVREMAAGFFELKVEKQDRIAIMSENCPQWLWADFSILSAAAVSVPIYPSFSQRETAYIINDSGAKILFVQNDQAMQRIMDVWDAMPCLERIIVMQDNSSIQHPYVLNLRDLREMGRGLLEKQPDALEKRLASIEMEDAMTIIYTSGTTGNQKGIIHTHRSFNAANEIDFKIIPHISSEDVLLSILPLSHSYERQFGQMMSICVGCTIAYADKSDSLIDSLQCFSPSWFVAAPSIFEKIFTAIWKEFDHSSHDRLMLANALTIGLEVVEANADEHGFIDASEQRDFLQGIL
ncbi:MAG: AMP-binding protein, partial [Bacillota bacterium]|nr:AMP-binding protein [Bacillota bacterium]